MQLVYNLLLLYCRVYPDLWGSQHSLYLKRTIPAIAASITIAEMKNHAQYIAIRILKSFIIKNRDFSRKAEKSNLHLSYLYMIALVEQMIAMYKNCFPKFPKLHL